MNDEQLSLGLEEPHALSLYCRIPGQPLARWDAHSADIDEAITAVYEQLAEAKVPKHGPVLALIHRNVPLPVCNTSV